MSDLSAAAVTAIDSTGQAGEILDLPEHLQDALWRVESADLAPRRSAGLVVAGMGGSAVGGLLAAAAIGDRATGPIVSVRGYALPPYVDESWTVLLSSYSGDTEETLACWDDATARGAHRIVTSIGGGLVERARPAGVPVIPLPGGFQPRTAVGYATAVAMEVAATAGVAPSLADEINAAAEHVGELGRQWGPDSPEDSDAKRLARTIGDRVPVFTGGGPTVPVAYRFKCQVNENANRPAFWSELPEANHNEIEGWSSDAPLLPVFLEDHVATHPRVLERFRLTAEQIGAERISAVGESPTARLMGLVHLGDLATLYLAVLHGNDPVDIPNLDGLKSKL